MKMRDDVALGQHSHVGMARTENQDFFGYWEADDDRAFDLKGRIVVVCDGMGGHAGGEIASRLGVKAIIDAYQKDASGNIQESLRNALESANSSIYKEGLREEKLKGMGSTCTTLVHRRDMVYFGQVGDSRGYLIRGGRIKQMTKDHSLVQQLVDEGLLDKKEMENHPDKNVILRSLGVKPQVDVDVSYVPTVPGDVFLLCSDGLSGPVSESEMLNIVQASNGEMKKASEQLIDLANKYGGPDNVTVQLLKVLRTDSATTDKTPQGTVTSSFSQDQVAASVAKARAEAVSKGKTVTPPVRDKDEGDDATSPTFAPPPAPPPRAAGGSSWLGELVRLGLALAIGGAVIWFGRDKIAPSPAAEPGALSAERRERAAKDAIAEAETARAPAEKANKNPPAAKKGLGRLEDARKALDAKEFEAAVAHAAAAGALFELAAGKQP